MVEKSKTKQNKISAGVIYTVDDKLLWKYHIKPEVVAKLI